MGYLRCESCGAKALSAASTCPKCAAPFSLHDGRGARVALKKCSNCGIMHRRDRSCHWCADVRPSAWRSPALLRSATGIAAVTLVAVGSWAVREQAGDAIAKAYNEATKSRPPVTAPAYAVEPQPTLDAALPPVAAAPQLDSLMIASAAGELDAADSIQWVPATARTWVNVRRDASRIGDVVGVIKPSERAMLGIGRSGWRQVKSPEVTGWVDPRLFEADSLRTRG
jgi:hypothetical protein